VSAWHESQRDSRTTVALALVLVLAGLVGGGVALWTILGMLWRVLSA
jgi:hypothetical protein